jgi:hypothetical protein
MGYAVTIDTSDTNESRDVPHCRGAIHCAQQGLVVALGGWRKEGRRACSPKKGDRKGPRPSRHATPAPTGTHGISTIERAFSLFEQY